MLILFPPTPCASLPLFRISAIAERIFSSPESNPLIRLSTILKKVTSNNNYDPILDVFTSLNQNMENNGLKLHANLRGYLDHGKTE